MPAPPPYKPTDAERALTGCYGACHALAASVRRMLEHDPARADLLFLLEAAESQLETFELEATERTRPVLARVRNKFSRTRTTTKENRR